MKQPWKSDPPVATRPGALAPWRRSACAGPARSGRRSPRCRPSPASASSATSARGCGGSRPGRGGGRGPPRPPRRGPAGRRRAVDAGLGDVARAAVGEPAVEGVVDVLAPLRPSPGPGRSGAVRCPPRLRPRPRRPRRSTPIPSSARRTAGSGCARPGPPAAPRARPAEGPPRARRSRRARAQTPRSGARPTVGRACDTRPRTRARAGPQVARRPSRLRPARPGCRGRLAPQPSSPPRPPARGSSPADPSRRRPVEWVCRSITTAGYRRSRRLPRPAGRRLEGSRSGNPRRGGEVGSSARREGAPGERGWIRRSEGSDMRAL